MERVSSVNAFQIKRQAHAVSRSDAGWNPFRHVWNRDHHRSQTWDGNDAEAQRGINPNDLEGSSPVTHSQTAPTSQQRDGPEGPDALSRASKESNHAKDPLERTDSSGETTVVAYQGAGEAPGAEGHGLRLRTSKTDNEKSEKRPEPEEKKKKRKDRSWFKHVEPKEPFTVANQIQRTLLNSWINVLLVAAPIGIALGAISGMNKIAVFVVNFIAIIPLAAMLSFATEEIALRTGETLGGLLNASFGYAYAFAPALMLFKIDPADQPLQKCRRAYCGHHGSREGRSRHCSDVTYRQCVVQSAACYGHVLLLRWTSQARAVLQRDCRPDCR